MTSIHFEDKVSEIIISQIKKQDVIGISTSTYKVIANGIYSSCKVENAAGEDFIYILNLIATYISPTLP